MKDERSAGYDAVTDLGALYDAVPMYEARPDVQFYVDAAIDAGGPILEAGCGTGRVLIPTARKGIRITGIDFSATMLNRCRTRLETESEETRANVMLHQADMKNFELGETFSLATIPFRPFQHLLTIGDQMAALRSIHDHLDPQGRLIFDVFNPNLAIIAAGAGPEREDTAPTPLPDGRTFRRTGRVTAVRITEQTSDVVLTYYITNPDGTEERQVHQFSMRWFLPLEIEHLLERCGFAVQNIYGNFDKSALVDGSPELIFVAERT